MNNNDTKTIMLPISGQTATVRRAKYRDARLASRHANPSEDPIGFAGALAASVVTIEGQPVVPEDIDDLDMEDVNYILSESGLGKSQSLIDKLSTVSAFKPDGAQPS